LAMQENITLQNMNVTNSLPSSISTVVADMTTWGIVKALFWAYLLQCIFSFVLSYIKVRHIPGPVPFLPPNILQGTNVPLSQFRKIWKEHGRVFCYWPGWIFVNPLIFVADAKALRQVLTQPDTFTKGPDYSVRFKLAIGDGMVTSVGHVHKRQRAVVARFFVKKRVDQLIPYMIERNNALFDQMGLTTKSAAGEITYKGNERFDMLYFAQAMTFRVINNLVWGKTHPECDLSSDLEYEKDSMEDVSYGQRVVGLRMLFKLPILSFDPDVIFVKKKLKKYHIRIDTIIEDRNVRFRSKDETKDQEPDDVLKALLDSGADRQEIYDQIQTIVFAGFETTATFISFAAFRIAKFPEVQERIRMEIKEVMGDRDEITADDVPKLKYLACVMKESMRYSPIIPVLTRVTTKNAKVTLTDGSSVIIPKGVDLLLPFHLLSYNDEIWDNPMGFDPDRFEGVADLQSPRHGFFPFSYGIRSCIGNLLAFTEGLIAMTNMLRNYRLERVKGFKPMTTLGISIVSKNGMYINMILDPIKCNETAIKDPFYCSETSNAEAEKSHKLSDKKVMVQ